MDELYRFSISRSADRTDAATVPLERDSKFQTNGPDPGPLGLVEIAASNSVTKWADFEQASLAFLLKTKITDIENLEKTQVARAERSLLEVLKNQKHADELWLADLRDLAGKLKSPAAQKSLEDFDVFLADLFLTLMILRSGGASNLHEIIRLRKPSAKIANPHFVEILLNRPPLDDLAELLRASHLIKIALNNPSQLKTAADIQAILDASISLPPLVFSSFEKPVHAVGLTDLLVVKQHILRYELGEIARIENILKGESRGHTQKHTLSNERETSIQTDKETQTDQELTSTDRVSLRNEIENTLKEDTKVDAGLHAQYSGVVNIQADLTVSYNRSSSETNKTATEIAKDVTQRAAKKVTERIRQSETTKIIETFEELEEQKFENKGGPNTSGVYQWVEKVYLAQVFNYGKHLLFDIMVPEPAASLLAADAIPLKKRPVPPHPLGTTKFRIVPGGGSVPALDADGNLQLLNPLVPGQLVEGPTDAAGYYGKWVGMYHVQGVQPPPSSMVVVSRAKSFPYQDDQFISSSEVIPIDIGFRAVSANIIADWITNDNPEHKIVGTLNPNKNVCIVDVTLGLNQIQPQLHCEDVFDGNTPRSGSKTQFINLNPPQEHSIPFSIITADINELSVNIELVCEPTPAAFAKWQLETYQLIAAAWQKLQDDYTVKLETMKLQQKQIGILGEAPPETNRQTERNELKRSCIAILDNKPLHGYDQVQVSPDTLADPNTLSHTFHGDGAWVRWFEQAFEWDKISYVFYPYFWGRSSEWMPRLQLKYDSDPLFENFLKAGYARVVVPVRTGFNKAVNFYMATGRPWMGGDLPHVGAETYLPITEEIKEQTGAPGKEKPVGEPWEYRIPTRLLKLRQDDKLPPDWQWVGHDDLYDPPGHFKDPAGTWNWKGDTGG